MSEESQILVASGSGIQTVVPQLAAVSPQVVYLDFDGAETSYDNRDLDIHIDKIVVEDSCFDSTDISYIVDALNEHFGDDIVFTADIPQTDEYSTIYIGITSAFEGYDSFLGIAETIDVGNQIHDDNAFVLLDSTSTMELVTSVITHETEHIVNGLEHDGDGLEKYAAITSIISSGQTVNELFVSSGMSIGVLGVLNSVNVNSGYICVSSGGLTNSTTINEGVIIIESGGVANSTMVSGGYADIYGEANFLIVDNDGWGYVGSEGVAHAITLSAGGNMTIDNDGTATDLTMLSGTTLWVNKGGVVNSTIVSKGNVFISNGGVVNSTTVIDGVVNIANGGVANSTIVSGGYTDIYGVVNSIIVNSDAWVYVGSKGMANAITLSAGGNMTIDNAGTATDLMMLSGATLWVEDGGVASGVTMSSAAALNLSIGGVVNSTMVNGGYADIYGEANFLTINNEGCVNVRIDGIANGIAVDNRGYLNVSSGGTALNTTVNSGGGVYVFSDGMVDNTTVNNNGYLGIYSGGIAANTTVNSGGDLRVSSGGIASNTTVSSSYLYVLSGGTADNTTVNNEGRFNVSSGGIANNTKVSSGGNLSVSSGGTATGIIAESGARLGIPIALNTYMEGTSAGIAFSYSHLANGITVSSENLTIYSGGMASDVTLTGGYLYVTNGGFANSTIVSSGYLRVSSGGTADNTIVNSGGYLGVSSGGSIDYTTVNNGGYLGVASGGTANNTTLNSDGRLFVSSGGMADGTTLNGGGYLYVLSGGSADNTTVNSDGRFNVSSGGIVDTTTLNSGGSLYVYNGVTVDNTTVNSGGYLYVASGGMANGITVNSGGKLWVLSGGTAEAIKENGGYVYVDDNASVSFVDNVLTDIVLSNSMTLHSGTTANNTTVNSGGRLYVSHGGMADNTTVNSGGDVYVLNGGTALNTTGSSFVHVYVSSGGMASKVMLIAGGWLYVYDSGSVVSANIGIGGELIVSSGGTAVNAMISSDGSLRVISGGTATGIIAESGAIFNIPIALNTYMEGTSAGVAFSYSHSVSGMTVSSGNLTIYSGGITSDVILKGQNLYISNGGVANSTMVNDGSIVIFSDGVANFTTVNKSVFAVIDIYNGGIANFTIVNGGDVYVYNGGFANSTTVSSGYLHVSSGGTADFTMVNNGGSLGVSSGGTANNTTVNSGGRFYITNGVTADYTTVNNGGYLYIHSGATASDVIVNSGGYLSVSSGGIVSDPTVNAGGFLVLGYGGIIANSVIANTGAYLSIASGGTALEIVENGGYVYADSEASATFVNNSFSGLILSGFPEPTTVHSGTTAVSTIVSDGGLYVFSGGTADGIIAHNGAYIEIISGGTALKIVENGGYVYTESDDSYVTFVPNCFSGLTISESPGATIHSGTTAISTTLTEWGNMSIYSGGIASSTTLLSSAYMDICSGGIAEGVVANTGVYLWIESGGSALEVVENGGCVDIEGDAYVTFVPNVFCGLTISEYASATVHSGTTAVSTTIDSEGFLYVFNGGIVDNITVLSGYLDVSSGGMAANITVHSGCLYVSSGGTAENVTWTPFSAELIIEDGATVTYSEMCGVYYGSDCQLLSSAASYMSGQIIDSGYGMHVMKSGTVSDIAIKNGGFLCVSSGGIANNTMVNREGCLYISRGGMANSTMVNKDGWLYVSSNGTANQTTVNSNGALVVYDGGIASLTCVEAGGELRVSAGGGLYEGTVLSGGYLVVNSGSIVSALTLQVGGYVELNGGVAVSALTLDVGATIGDLTNTGSSAIVLESYSDGIVSGKLENASLGGLLSINTGTELKGLSGSFKLRIDDTEGDYTISGNDFSQMTLELGGNGVIDLSGNYWGMTDIDAIYERLGVDSTRVRIDDVLGRNPNAVFFTLESTNLNKNYLAPRQTSISFIFNALLDEASISSDSITFVSTSGKSVAIQNTTVQGNVLKVDFKELTSEGVYTILFADTIRDLDGNALTSIRHDYLADGIGEQLRITARLSGASVVKVSPSGDIAGTLTTFLVYFSKSVNPTTLLDNVKLISPNGTAVTPTSVRMLNDSTAEFTVPAQTEVGKYSVQISANVADYAGTSLDQNGNGIGGETNDGFVSTFSLTEIDLSIKDVQVAEKLTVGETATITWKVANESGAALMGNWTDGVYLSTDAKWDIGDTLLTTYTHENGLNTGETLFAETSLNLLGVNAGSYYLLVRSDIYNDEDTGVAASVAAQNLVATHITVEVPQLVVGESVIGNFTASGDFASYHVRQEAGEALQFNLDSQIDTANLEIYVGYGQSPSREQYDVKLQRITDAVMTIDAGIVPRDVYILIYAKSTTMAFDYSLSARKAPASIEKIMQSGQDGSEAITLTITGRNFMNGMTARLVAADGTATVLQNVILSNTTKLTSTIAAGMFTAGDYKLELVDVDSTVVDSQPVVISDVADEGKLEYSFYAPAVVGRAMDHTLSLTVSNTGTAAIDAPLVCFTPTQSHANGTETMGAMLSLNYDQSVFWVSTMPAGYSDSLSFFVNNDGSSMIEPGESVSIPIYYTGWRSDDWDFGDSHINWNTCVLYADDSTTLQWKEVFQKSGLSITAENLLTQSFSSEFGDTWGGYYEVVVDNLHYLDEIGLGVGPVDTSSMLRFEAMQKTGVLQPFQNLVTMDDLIMDESNIAIQRSYNIGEGMVSEGGSFGYGWAFNWDVQLLTTANGDVQIVQGGTRRIYQPTATFGYQTVCKDGSSLKNNAAGYRLTDVDGSQWQFDIDGRLLYVIESTGERISCSYDAGGRLARIINTSTGDYVSFVRDVETDLITAVKDSTGRTISYAYSEDNDLISVTDSIVGVTATYEYYAPIKHVLTKAMDGDGVATRNKATDGDDVATSFAYDELGRIVSMTNVDGTITLAYGTAGDVTLTSGDAQITLFYDPSGNIAKITDDITGKIYTYLYDENGEFISGEDSDGNVLTSQYSFATQVLDVCYSGVDFSTLDFNVVYNTNINTNHYVVDGITYYKTDKDGNILRQNDTADEYYVAGYDESGNIVSYEYLKNVVTTTYSFAEDGSISILQDDPSQYFVIDGIKYFRKDMEGNVLGQYDTDVDSYTLGYDAAGNRVFYAYAHDGETTSYQYDLNGNVVSMINTDGMTTYTYDADGNKMTEIEPDGTIYRYDANGNLSSITDTEGKVTSYTYDGNGNVISVTSEGKTVLYDYDVTGNLTSYTDEHGNVYAYTYDMDGRQTSVTINAKTTSYTYDENGNYASVTDPNGNTCLYSYNADGMLLQFTDANDNVTTYTYNDANDLTCITYADGTFEAYTYNSDGELTGWTGRAGQTAAYSYNANGDFIGIVYSDGKENTYTYNADGDLLSANDIVFTYDADGNCTTQNFADGRSIQYTYNDEGQMVSYTDELGHAVNYTYTVDGQYDLLTDENGGFIVDNDYDMNGYLVKASYGNGTSTTYMYDDFGQVTAIDNYGADGSVASFVHYAYDSEGKRTSMTTADGTWAYTYDAKDQLIGAIFKDNTGTKTQELAYTYDAMGNRLTSTENGVTTIYTYNELNQIVSANGFEYHYDANGNLLEDEKRIYTWTVDNRVASETLKSTGQTWEYGYDALGNRISSSTNGITTSWTIDSNGNVLAEYVNDAWNRTYYQGNLLTGFIDKDGNEYFYNADALGTTISVTGIDGSAINSYTYDPWGNVLNSIEGVSNDFTFIGGYGLMQNDTGTYFVRARNYDPQIGRWISPDPIGIEGGENLYVYCGNDVVNKNDIWGLYTIINIQLESWCGHGGMQVNQSYLSAQPWLFSDQNTKDKWDKYWRDKSLYYSFHVYTTADMEKAMEKYIDKYNLALMLENISIINGNILNRNWFTGDCVAQIARALRKAQYDVSSTFRVKPFFEFLSGSTGDFLEQQEEKAKAKLKYEGFGFYSIRSIGNKEDYTFVYNPYPIANIKIKNEKHHIDGSISMDLYGGDSYDPPGFNSKNGVLIYDWYELKYDEFRQEYHYLKSLGSLYDKKISITITPEEKTRYFGLRVCDKEKGVSQNGNLMYRNGDSPIPVKVISVTNKGFVPIPIISGDKSSVSLKAGQTAIFTLTGKMADTPAGGYVTNYKWSFSKENTSIITISVTAEKQSDGTVKYKWSDGFVGSFHQISLSVTASNGLTSLAPASIILAVTSDISTSNDPNDKTVVEGIGDAGYIQAGTKLSYTIEFENDPEFATAPAQWVRVFDTLDGSKYDLDSFELQEFCIAGNYFTVGDGRDSFNRTVELAILDYAITATISINLVRDEDMEVTQLVAEFMAIDPESGFMLQDLENGLLPVNDVLGSGEGHISYTINALDDLPSGTEITNSAKIYFDFNDPIDTPTTLNTIDMDAPVITLTGDTTTPLQSAKLAASTEAGVNIYWSTDNENWWIYEGELDVTANGTYYFKATDAVGNVGTAQITFDNIDTVAPIIELTGDAMTPLQKATLTASTEDDLKIFYNTSSADFDGEWMEYTGEIVVETNGTYYFKATDAAGNTGTKSITFTNIDTVDPVIKLNGDTTNPLQSAKLTASTEDGVDIYWSTDNETWTKYDSELNITANGTYYFKATDAAGNTGTAEIEFDNIDTTAPVISDIMADVTAPTNGKVVVTAFASDDMNNVELFYSKNDGEFVAYNGGVEFTANGNVVFKAVDAAGNETVSEAFDVTNIDVVAPVISGIAADVTTPTNGKVTVTANASDDVNAVTLFYSKNGGEFAVYENGVEFTANGSVVFKAVDAAGNETLSDAFEVSNIDMVAPIITLMGDTTNPLQKSTLTALTEEDVDIYWSTDNSNWSKYEGLLNISTNGTYFFKATDDAGNTGTAQITFANIDTVAPTIFDIDADVTTPTNGKVMVTASASDNANDVSLFYSKDGGEFAIYDNGVEFTENGNVVFKAVDAAGNQTVSETFAVTNIDKIAPIITLFGDTTTSLQTSTLTATTETGLDIFWSIDNKTWTKYEGKLDITSNGTYYFKATDVAGNTGMAQITFANIDDGAPVITLTGDTTTPLQKSTLSATTNEDVDIYWSTDNTSWTKYSGPLDITSNGIYYFKATDAADNTGTNSIIFTNIDTVAPVIELLADTTTPLQKSRLAASTEAEVDIYWSTDNVNWSQYDSELDVTANGTWYFKATDAAGNTGVAQIAFTNIDTVKPTISNVHADVTAPTNGKIVVTAQAGDDANDITLFYSKDGGEFVAYDGGVEFTDNGNVVFKAVDAAGNETVSEAFEITNIDKVAPVIELTGDTTSSLQATKLTASTEVGVDIYWSTDNAHWTKYEGELDITANGTYYFKATDAAGNTGTEQITFANLDTGAPVITLTGDNTTPLQKSTLSATVDDDVDIYWSMDNETWTKYEGELDITANGTYYFKATDEAGNTGTNSIVFANIDTSAPAIELLADTATPLQSAKLAASTEASLDIYWSTDNAHWTKYDSELNVTANGTWYFKATDAAGNTGVAQIVFENIDTVAPSVAHLEISQPDESGLVTLSVVANETLLKLQYSWKDGEWLDASDGTIPVAENGSVRFRLTDLAGNETVTESHAVEAFDILVTAIDTETTGDGATFNWGDDATATWADQYDVVIGTANGNIDLPGISAEGVELLNAPSGEIALSVKPRQSDIWTEGGSVTIPNGNETASKYVQAEENGMADVMFATGSFAWNGNYQAQHVGVGEWDGTGETAKLDGKNQITDIFAGSDDASILLMTDDENGDALFIDDIYSAFPEGFDAQARLAKIDEIRAGAGNDIVDLTSQRFNYIGGGMTVKGGLGDDIIWANNGDNTLFGDAGNDRIVGASGNDVIVGGSGDDSLHGGGGDDIFAFGGAWGNDYVEQLADGKVTLWFEDGSLEKWNASTLTYQDGEKSVKISGVSAENVTLKFGDDGSQQYSKLLESGAFDEFSSERIFENKNRGMLA